MTQVCYNCFAFFDEDELTETQLQVRLTLRQTLTIRRDRKLCGTCLDFELIKEVVSKYD